MAVAWSLVCCDVYEGGGWTAVALGHCGGSGGGGGSLEGAILVLVVTGSRRCGWRVSVTVQGSGSGGGGSKGAIFLLMVGIFIMVEEYLKN